MTIRYADRVFQTSATTGTGAYLLGPAMPGGYRGFEAVPGIVDGDQVYVSIDQEYSDEYEVGLYTYRDSGFLERTEIIASSRDGLPVPWPSGATRRVSLTLTAAQVDGSNLQYVGAAVSTDRVLAMRSGVFVLVDPPTGSSGEPTVPGAVIIGTAQAGNATVSIYFSPPVSNGGSAILDYTAYLSDGTSVTSAVSPIVFTGKINGQPYTGYVRARNAQGQGVPSATSNSVTPTSNATVPGAPTNAVATAGDGSVSVAFAVPLDNGGSAILDYTVTLSTGQTATGSASPISVACPNGTPVSATVKARNVVGLSAASSISNVVTPTQAATVPGAPTNVVLTGGDRQVSVAFTAPASNGGSAILDYTATLTTGQTGTSATSPIVIMVPGSIPVTAFVRARNAVGQSVPSAASNSVTPTDSTAIGGLALGGSYTDPQGMAWTLANGDDFNGPLSLMTAATPDGKYATSRVYQLAADGQTPREAASIIGLIGYDSDPLNTGHIDSNRGQPIASMADMITQTDSYIRLKSRPSSSAEKLLLNPATPRTHLSAMISMAPSMLARAPYLIRAKVRFISSNGPNVRPPRGSHRSIFTKSMSPPRSYTGWETDWEEETAPNTGWGFRIYTSLNGTGSAPDSPAYTQAILDGAWHIAGVKVIPDPNNAGKFIVSGFWQALEGGTEIVYRTEVNQSATYADSVANQMFSNHITGFDFVAGDWGVGSFTHFDIDWCQMFGNPRTPLLTQNSIAIPAGGSFDVTLPPPADAWGSATVHDSVEALMLEVNEPGGGNYGGYGTDSAALDAVPAGMGLIRNVDGSINFFTGTRTGGPTGTKAAAPWIGKPGRLHLIRKGALPGEVVVPQRFHVDVGPRVYAAPQMPDFVSGVPYTYTIPYFSIDCGTLCVGASWATSNLPAGVTAATQTNGDLLISGTPSANQAATGVNIMRTNSAGQSITVPGRGYTADLAMPFLDDLVCDLNPDDAASLTLVGNLVTGITSGSGGTRGATAPQANAPTLVTVGNRKALRFAGAQYMDIAAALGSDINASLQYTIVMVASVNTVTASQCLLDIGTPASASTADRIDILSVNGSGLLHRKANGSASLDAFDAVGAAGAGAYGNVNGQVNLTIAHSFNVASQAELNINHSAKYLSSTSAFTGNPTAATLGARRAANAYGLFLTGDIYRVAVYTRQKPAAQRSVLPDWSRGRFLTS